LLLARNYPREGDILVVWKLDRLGRSLEHLIEVVRELNDRGIGFKIILKSLDTTTSGGRLIFHVFGAIAEFERDLIRERTNAGLEAARARGKKGGRRRVLTEKQISIGKSLAADKNRSVSDICETLKISPATYYRYIH
jgi:DNA invertase Pin-like site-specific DNA recombinase